MVYKFAILGIFFFLLLNTSVAQKVGLKGGVNFTNLYEENITDENMKIGINGGLYIRSKGEKVSFQSEFLYSRKGSEMKYENFQNSGNSGKYRYNMGYLEAPLLLVFHINKVNFQVGPYIGWLLHVHVKNVDDKGFIQEIEELDRDDFNTIDWGPSFGIGIDFPAGIVGIRYNMGLRGIGENGVIATEESQNSALQFYLGFNL